MSNSWFPVLTLILGFVAKSVLDWLQDRRLDHREAEKRREELRRDTQIRKTEFQRVTLLELQEAAALFVKNVGSANHHDVMEGQKNGQWGHPLLPVKLNDDLYQHQNRTKLLSVRIHDDTVRTLSAELNDVSSQILHAESEAHSRALFEREGTVIEALNERIGELLRAIDDQI